MRKGAERLADRFGVHSTERLQLDRRFQLQLPQSRRLLQQTPLIRSDPERDVKGGCGFGWSPESGFANKAEQNRIKPNDIPQTSFGAQFFHGSCFGLPCLGGCHQDLHLFIEDPEPTKQEARRCAPCMPRLQPTSTEQNHRATFPCALTWPKSTQKIAVPLSVSNLAYPKKIQNTNFEIRARGISRPSPRSTHRKNGNLNSWDPEPLVIKSL